MSFLRDFLGGGASRRGAGQLEAAQSRALDYLVERERLPQRARERLAGIAGVPGGEGSQQALIEEARRSPLYSAIKGTQQEGEEAILRQAGATGGLRSGNVQDALAKNAQQLEQNALLTAYQDQLSGLRAVAGQPSLAPQIAQVQTGIGQTQAQGTVGAAQSRQAGLGQLANIGIGIGNLGARAGWWSDAALKSDIQYVGTQNGHKVYDWVWNEAAAALGLFGKGRGVLAHEVESTMPEAISERGGYKIVNYDMIGVDHA